MRMDGQLYSIAEFQHVKPGKGGAFVRTKLKKIPEGSVIDRTFRAGEKVDEATRKTITEDGWLRSGDLGILDEAGNLRITGRHKDMIIRGGENIYPREIEEFLYHMDGIKDVQVAAVPSPKYGEEVGAFVIRREEANIEASDVIDFCRGKIARFKVPKYVHFVDGYPMTASGKIQKYKLSEMSEEIWPERI